MRVGDKLGMDLGQMLAFDNVERGLKELNSDISLDVPERRPSDWSYMFTPVSVEAGKAQRKGRAAVYHGERYICAIDRGNIPEIKVYGVKRGIIPIPMTDIDEYEDSKVTFLEIKPESHLYHAAVSKVERGDDNFTRHKDGRVFMYEAMTFGDVRGDVQKLGWRHTFEALLRRDIPGVDRSSLARKFNVDMLKYPCGAPEEVREALLAE